MLKNMRLLCFKLGFPAANFILDQQTILKIQRPSSWIQVRACDQMLIPVSTDALKVLTVDAVFPQMDIQLTIINRPLLAFSKLTQ